MRSHRRSFGFLLSFLTVMAAAGSAAAQPYFEQKNNVISAQNWTNYARLTDIDNDGDLDVLLPNAAGFNNTKGGSEPFIIYRNDGNFTFTDVSATAVGGFSGWLRQVATADISGDGFVDLYAPDAWGGADKFWINDGTGKFTDEAATRLPGVNSRAGYTRFGDVDNDGDMDLLVGDEYSGNSGKIAHLYINDGTGHFAEAGWQLPGGGDQPIDVDLLDADGDFDLDLFIDSHFSKGSLWLNDGTGQFTDASANIPSQSGNKYGPVSCDVDNDGDLDIWQDNSGPNYTEQLMINDGTGKFTDETAQRVTGNLAQADDNGLACVDLDGDGDFDAAIFNLFSGERLLVNDGTGHFNNLPGAFPSGNDSTLWIDFGDLNGDGRLDYVSAQGESSSLDKIFGGIDPLPIDTFAPRIRAVESVGSVAAGESPVVRFGVTDNTTTDEGPRLQKAYLDITEPAAMQITASFMGGDLFRGVLPSQSDGTQVSFQACAIDRMGNKGCSKAITYTVGGGSPASSSSGMGGGGTGGVGGHGAMGGGGTGMGAGGPGGNGMGANGPGGGGNGTGGTGGGFTFEGGDGNCGCSVPGASPGTGALALGLAGALSALARRRRRNPRRDR